MSLSVGTLNLKFMQRAAARASQPAAPALPKGVDPAEEAAKWTLPSRSAAPKAANAEAGPSRPKVQFVSSYLPFLEDAGEADAAASGGGGRLAFGGFGSKPTEEDGGEDEDEEMLDSDDDSLLHLRRQKEKAEESKPTSAPQIPRESTPEPTPITSASQGFVRPAGFSPPPSAKKKKPKKPASTPGHSQADKLRSTIADLKAVSMSPTTSNASGISASAPSNGKKRALPESDVGAIKKAKKDKSKGEKKDGKDKSEGKESKPKGKQMSALDKREAEIKAAKKAAKKKAQ